MDLAGAGFEAAVDDDAEGGDPGDYDEDDQYYVARQEGIFAFLAAVVQTVQARIAFRVLVTVVPAGFRAGCAYGVVGAVALAAAGAHGVALAVFLASDVAVLEVGAAVLVATARPALEVEIAIVLVIL